jgi:hypothetical protein
MSSEPAVRNPMRDRFEELKRKHPELAHYADYALANLNDVDPLDVLRKLPEKYPLLWQKTFTRGQRLVPLIQRAVDAECYVEALILCHGVIQICLRTLYVSVWQRTEDRPLTDLEVRPYFEERKAEGSLAGLIDRCVEKEIIEPEQGTLLRRVNQGRNRAAHGVFTGEIEPAELAEAARKAQWAAVGALDRLQGWINNPCKFYWKRDGVPFRSRHPR